MKEKQILFPYVLRMEQSVIASEIAPPAMFGTVMNPGEPPVKSRARRRGGLAANRRADADEIRYARPAAFW